MKGTVSLINYNRDMVAVTTENGDYTIFEVLGGHNLELGDVIFGDLDSLAGDTLTNLSKEEEMDVFIEDIHSSREHAIELLRD